MTAYNYIMCGKWVCGGCDISMLWAVFFMNCAVMFQVGGVSGWEVWAGGTPPMKDLWVLVWLPTHWRIYNVAVFPNRGDRGDD
jgi:hypothetical protein